MSVVFIGGAQRSGTTLFQTLLASCMPESPNLPEAHVICDLVYVYRRAKQEWKKSGHFFENAEELRAFFAETVKRLLDQLRGRYSNSENLVLKDPNFAPVLSELTELVPGCITFLCVRDPRDIVASYLKIGSRNEDTTDDSPYSRRDLNYMCRVISAQYEAYLDGRCPQSVHVVKYEHIATDAAGTLVSLASKTLLPIDTARLSELEWLEAESRHERPWISELEGRPPTADNIGNFRTILNWHELGYVERRCGRTMDSFGYSRVTGYMRQQVGCLMEGMRLARRWYARQ